MLIIGRCSLAAIGVSFLVASATSAKPRDEDGTRLAPRLGVASNFGHDDQGNLLESALRLGFRDFRDIIYWSSVETRPGEYLFDDISTNYPDKLSSAGAQMSLTLNWGNELYAGGATPYTEDSRAALARFVVAALDAFPAIMAVEVGNEFNGQNFIKGPILDMKREARAAPYFELLRTVREAVDATHPETGVLGGAAHSMPLGYLWPLLDFGAAGYMDALVLHPYTSSPEQFPRQVEVLRRHPDAAELPLQITEFGHKDERGAPGFLLRMYCSMALAGAERVVWYPLNDRGDGLVPLMEPDLMVATATGRAFLFVQDELSGRPVADVRPDPFTYGCKFGEDRVIIWGEPRDVRVDDGVSARNADGVLLDPVSLRLSLDEPLVLMSDEPITLGDGFHLSPTDIIADSYHEFSYPEGEQVNGLDDSFDRYAQRGKKRIELVMMPGQDSSGTPWTPYRGNRFIRPARLQADIVVPGGTSDDPIKIVHSYMADQTVAVSIETAWLVSGRSEDGIEVSIWHEDDRIHGETVSDRAIIDFEEVQLRKGERLTFVVGPGHTAKGDVASYRITLKLAD